MKGRVKWVEAMTFVAESESGHALVMDGSPEVGGRNLGMRPMEMVLLGMAGCTAFDVVTILKRGRHAVTDCSIEVTAERAEEHPKVFTRIHVQYTVSGRGLAEAAVARAVKLSAETYCSASAMLGKTATITHSHEIVAAE
ncbi:MAG: OsmC family protein [Myxococcota bacterium]